MVWDKSEICSQYNHMKIFKLILKKTLNFSKPICGHALRGVSNFWKKYWLKKKKWLHLSNKINMWEVPLALTQYCVSNIFLDYFIFKSPCIVFCVYVVVIGTSLKISICISYIEYFTLSRHASILNCKL